MPVTQSIQSIQAMMGFQPQPTTEDKIRRDFERAKAELNERTLRAFVASMARDVGYGGVTLVHRATGVARSTIKRGIQEMEAVTRDPRAVPAAGRIRREGGGRFPVTAHYPGLNDSIVDVLEPGPRIGWEEPPLRWTLESTRRLSEVMKGRGIDVSPSTVRKQLRAMGFALQTNSRVPEAPGPADAQFAGICRRVSDEIEAGNPVVSIECRRLFKGEPPAFDRWRRRSYPSPAWPASRGRGLFDMGRIRHGCEVATHRTDPEFAAQSLYGWWRVHGRKLFRGAGRLYLAVGRGASSVSNRYAWQSPAYQLASSIRMPVAVSHFQPGTSRWDPRIARRIFSFFSTGWEGGLEADYQTTAYLITPGDCPEPLRALCRLNHTAHPQPRRRRGDDKEAQAHTVRDLERGDLNYTLSPLKKARPSGARRLKGAGDAPEAIPAEVQAPPPMLFIDPVRSFD
jgi:hypothetical protein